MAIVYVHASRTRDFLNHYTEWCRSRPREGLVRIYMMPPEGPPIGEEKQFLKVPDTFLAYLTEKRFPYRLG